MSSLIVCEWITTNSGEAKSIVTVDLFKCDLTGALLSSKTVKKSILVSHSKVFGRSWLASAPTTSRIATNIPKTFRYFDSLDVRGMRHRGLFGDGWITFHRVLGWHSIAQMRVARYAILLDLRGRVVPQFEFSALNERSRPYPALPPSR